MSEENKMIFCTECGSANKPGAKFCNECGAKMMQAGGAPEQEKAAQPEDWFKSQENEQPAAQPSEGVFSGDNAAPVYEKVTDAEEVKPDPIPNGDEIHINYDQNTYSTPYSEPPVQSYSPIPEEKENKTGGNIGFAIASLVCGILSLLCCCLTVFSIVMGIAAVVLGIITIACKYDGKGMAIAGIITGAVGLVFLIIGAVISGTEAYRELVNEIANELY